MFRWSLSLLVCVAACLIGGAAVAQLDRPALSVQTEDLGYAGFVRPGGWVPLRVTVDNPTADDLELRVGWSVRDADGDEVLARRTAVINAQRREQLWVYAPVSMSETKDAAWTVQAASTEAGGVALEPLTLRVSPSRWVTPGTGMIALMSGRDLGLDDYAQHATQHEPLTVIQDLSLSDLPDQALGLSSLDAIIWTDDTGGDPAGADVPASVFPALREYVYRGGHLVVVLPGVGQTWTQSPLADMLPVPPQRVRRVTGPVPRIGAVMHPEATTVSMNIFDTRDSPGATTLARNEAGEPIVVSSRRGFGRVTLIGVDLTDAIPFDSQLNSGDSRLWNTVFGWTAPVFTQSQVKQGLNPSDGSPATLKPASQMPPRRLAGFVSGRVAMRGTISTILLVAIGLLILYVAAAALSQVALKVRGAPQHAWVVFGALVLGFSVVAWSGAWVARPATLQAHHVSVMDVDGNAGTARVRSWVSLFVPRFGVAEVALPEASFPPIGAVQNNLASLGFEPDGGIGFLDTQRYAVTADDPATLNLPVRSTTRRLTLDVLTTETMEVQGEAGAANLGPGSFMASEAPAHDPAAGTLTARLQHSLPGPLHDVTVVYCPGEGYRGAGRAVLTPWVWRPNVDAGSGRRAPWTPGQTLAIDGRPTNAQPLVRRPAVYREDRNTKDEGYLGVLLDQHRGVAEQALTGDDAVSRELELLSFFGALPPPLFTKTDWPPPPALRRPLGHDLDLTGLLSGPRLIILGHLRDAPLPSAISVDGANPPSTGWTLVRLIYDL